MSRELRDVLIALVAIAGVVVILIAAFNQFTSVFKTAAEINALVSAIVGVIGTIVGAVFGANAGAQASAGERARLTQNLNRAEALLSENQGLIARYRAAG